VVPPPDGEVVRPSGRVLVPVGRVVPPEGPFDLDSAVGRTVWVGGGVVPPCGGVVPDAANATAGATVRMIGADQPALSSVRREIDAHPSGRSSVSDLIGRSTLTSDIPPNDLAQCVGQRRRSVPYAVPSHENPKNSPFSRRA
jgi:hypothetical protein